MPTNDERREVAKKLRERTKRPMGKSMQRMFTETLGMYTYNVCWMNPDKAISRWDAIVNYLADLIEPQERTCHAVRIAVPFDPRDFPDDLVEVYQFRCSECSVLLEYDWRFCPNCGARVVPNE